MMWRVGVVCAAAAVLAVAGGAVGPRHDEGGVGEVARSAEENEAPPRADGRIPPGRAAVPAAPEQVPASSIIRKIRWDNGEFSSNFQTTYTRSDATVGVDGTTIPAGVRRYAEPHLLCPPPTLVPRRTSNVRQSRVWSGRWQNMSDCLAEVWLASNSTSFVGLSVDGNYPAEASRTKSLGSANAPNLFAGDSPDPAPGEKHAPLTFVIADGCVLAFCEVRLGEVPATYSAAASVCYWDENVASTSEDDQGSVHGELKWKHHRTGPVIQAGKRRGDVWMASGPWVPPGGMDQASGKLVDFFAAFTDYRNNPGSGGGQLFIVRCHRASPDAKWTLEPAIMLYTDEPGTQLVAIPGETNYMHFHSAAITFPGGGIEGRRMVVTLSVGDGWPNNRMVNIARDDYLTYDSAIDDPSEPRAKNPTPGAFIPDTPTCNGWTTYEDREGGRARVTFPKDSSGAYTARFMNSPPRIEPMADPGAFAGYTHPGGITPVYFSGADSGYYGPGSIGITGKDNAGNLLLDYAYASTSPMMMSGGTWADRGIQTAFMFPTTDRSAFLSGGDESSVWMYRVAITDPAARIQSLSIAGIPTMATRGYNGAGICLNWLCLVGSSRLGQVAGDYAVTDYLALVRPNSIGGWINESAPQALMYSPDGMHWGEMLATGYNSGDRSNPSAFFRQTEGGTTRDRVFVGRADTFGLWAFDTPTPQTTVLARPLQISAGGVNGLAVYSEGNPATPSVERTAAPSAHNACWPVARSAMGTGAYANVPPPPCEGPIIRCQFIDSNRMGTWKVGKEMALGYRPKVKGRIWVYRMPPSDTGNPNDFPVSSVAKLSFFGNAVKSGEVMQDYNLYQGPTIGGSGGDTTPAAGEVQGTGWTPFTFEVSPQGSGGPGTYAFMMKVVSNNNEFNRQDVLVAIDYVGYADADGFVDLPARPMKYGAAAQPDKLEIRYLPASGVAEPTPTITPWTMVTAFTLPTAGPDAKTYNRSSLDGVLTLFTLWSSKTSYLRVMLDREFGGVWIADQYGNAMALDGPGTGADGVPFAQPFFAARGRQVLIGLTCEDSGDGTARYRAWVSMGGTRLDVLSSTALAGVTPNRIRMGDQNQQNIDPADYFGFYVDEGHAMTDAEMRATLGDLRFLK